MAAVGDHAAFVGREPELAQLRAAFDAAVAGRAGLVLVVGEPGIGKTTLCARLAAQVRADSGLARTGHCYEDGSLSLPYLPFIEALRAHARAVPPAQLRREWGSGAADLARIVPELRELLGVEPPPPTDPEADRYRLFEAVGAALQGIAASQPLLLVLEDLHDADRGTLDLLLHLARGLPKDGEPPPLAAAGSGAGGHAAGGARLLIAGTYRDVEVDRAHPLSAALAEVRRVAPLVRVRLRGLTLPEVERLVEAVAGSEGPAGLAGAVFQQTEGNPLFVQEVLRYLVEEGLLRREGGDRRPAVNGAALVAGIPEGLRDVVGKRLSRLSTEANRVLAVAAVAGREFELAVLAAIVTVEEEALLAALEEAVHAGVLEEQERAGAVRYRFSHAFFRQTLYEELIAARRIRLHGQVARALETRYANRLDGHAAELAEHFSHSSDPADLAKAVAYGERAARQALSVYAYSEAVRLLEQAMQVQEVLDPDDQARRCDLLLALGEALTPAGEPRRTVDAIAPEALALAEALDDRPQAFRACQMALTALRGWGQGAVGGTLEYRELAERAGRYAAPGSVASVRADFELAYFYRNAGAFEAARPLAVRALALARTLGDPNLLYWVATGFITGLSIAPQHDDERYRLIEEVIAAWPRAGVEPRPLGVVLAFAGFVFLDRGERSRAEAVWRELDEVAARTKIPAVVIDMMMVQSVLATVEGRLEDSVHVSVRLLAYAGDNGMVATSRLSGGHVAQRPLLYLGRGEEAPAALPPPNPSGGPEDLWFHELFRSVCHAHLGHRAEAQRTLDRHLRERQIAAPADETPITYLVQLLEIAVLVEDRDAAGILAVRLAPVAYLATTEWILTSVARQLGAAAALLGRPEEARAYYQQALDVTERIRFRPEAALTRLHLAELLLAHYPDEQAEAQAQLEVAIPELQEMGMRPALARAEALAAEMGTGPLPQPSRVHAAAAGPETPREAGEVNTAAPPVAAPVPSPEPLARPAGVGSVSRAATPADGPDPSVSVPAAATPTRVGQALPPAERILATVLFTDIAASTEQVVALGDRRWRELKEQHHALVRAELARFRGREVDTAGDGFFAVFDAPARAIDCARAIQAAVRGLGLELRAGLHLGEVEVDGDGGVTGIAVHIGARVAALAAAGEVLVSATVRDVAAGSELRFRERGHHALKGLPGEWALYRVEAGDQG